MVRWDTEENMSSLCYDNNEKDEKESTRWKTASYEIHLKASII